MEGCGMFLCLVVSVLLFSRWHIGMFYDGRRLAVIVYVLASLFFIMR